MKTFRICLLDLFNGQKQFVTIKDSNRESAETQAARPGFSVLYWLTEYDDDDCEADEGEFRE